MRNAIVWLAFVAPILLLLLWPHAPLAGIVLLMISHGLVLYPTLRPNVQWLGPVITRFEPRGKEVWLTIDDGPTDDTRAIADLLDARGAKATFFVKGTLAEQQPDVIRELLARGHGIANHSRTHPAGTFWCLPPAAIAAEIDGCNRAIEAITGNAPLLFRAPVGFKNPAVHPQLRKRGMQLVGWSVRAFDAVESNVEKVAARIVPHVDSGSIIVMHQGRAHSLPCITRVVDDLMARGYSFVVPDVGRLKTKR